MTGVASLRAQLLELLFAEGVPKLWCPPLTHYDAEGAIDRVRGAAHLAFIARWSLGWFVPGSTGDAWELSPEESREVVDLALTEAGRRHAHVLVGALHRDADVAARLLSEGRELLYAHEAAAAICGFALCPPRGEDLSQEELDEALSHLLALGVPVALYQLPQVTLNEMSPQLVQDLALRFSNFVLFKDTSGADRVASAGADLGGLFLVRGAEGDYARHLQLNGGHYDGLLLSSANSFGAQLQAIAELSTEGRRQEAEALSERLSSLVAAVFRVVEGLPDGNAFTNAAKAVDHFFAHGPAARTAPAPCLHSGGRLPKPVLEATEDLLRRYGLLPSQGYLEGR